MGTIELVLERMRQQKRGYWALSRHNSHFTEQFRDFTQYSVVSQEARDLILNPQNSGDLFEEFFAQILSDSSQFLHPAGWMLFWSLASAAESITRVARNDDQEPELNGAFIEAIDCAARSFRGHNFPDYGFQQLLTLAIANLAKRGNEARTGGDFGVIVEIEGEQCTAFVTMVFQAKRAPTRSVSVNRAAGDSTQLERLLHKDRGAYLFYNQHDDPTGLCPTAKSANLVDIESNHGRNAVDPLNLVDDFAARVTAGVMSATSRKLSVLPGKPMHGTSIFDSRDDALEVIYPRDVPELAVSDLLIARIAEWTFDGREVMAWEAKWTEAVAKHREGVRRSHDAPHGNDENEPSDL